jgi:hypothetical protein
MSDEPQDQPQQRIAPDPAIRGDAQTALLAAYAILAFAAVGRSTFELVTKFSDAPVAYSLSTVAAVIYLVATWAIWDGGRTAIIVGRVTCTFELIGVLVVGTITTFDHSALPVETVWSYYGRDYGWLPLVIPALALWWLYKQHPDD